MLNQRRDRIGCAALNEYVQAHPQPLCAELQGALPSWAGRRTLKVSLQPQTGVHECRFITIHLLLWRCILSQLSYFAVGFGNTQSCPEMGRIMDTVLGTSGGVFLANRPASRGQRRLALSVVAVSVAVFSCFAPFAKVQLAPVFAFLPVYQTSLFVNDLITAILLFGVFRSQRSSALLFLAGGYLFTATLTVFHTLSFPGLFAATGLLGAGTQTTAWLYEFWHGGFPLAVIAYALTKNRRDVAHWRAYVAIPVCAAVAIATAIALTLLATVGQDLLIPIMDGNRYTPAGPWVLRTIWSVCLVALGVLWWRRPHSFLDMWLMVVMCAWVFDMGLAAVFNHGRFDLGWYAGRIFGLLAVSVVLVALLLENGRLYFDLARAHQGEQQARRQAESQAAELMEANKHLDAFASSVSHDLRAPLVALSGILTMLEEDHGHKFDADGRGLLARVHERIQKMDELIDALLFFARLGRQPVRTSQVPLDGLVAETIDELRQTYGAREIRFSVAKLGVVTADPVLVKHVLANLLGNAVKFTRNRSPAIVEVGSQVDPAEGGQTIYWVRDNGAGFDMHYADKLFGLFQRLHRQEEFEGNGVGLSIVQGIVKRHGGRIWADSQPGRGATFYFTLPQGTATAS
jgi:signal transduction histidine kinase